MSALVISVAVRNEGPQPRGQTCLFLRPQKQVHVRHVCQSLGFAHRVPRCWAETSAALGLETTSSWCAYGFGGNLAVSGVFAPFQQKLAFYHCARVLGFRFNLILILSPTTRNPGPSLIPMGREYKTCLGVPGWQWFFCSWAVPGGLGGMKVGMSMVHLTLFSNVYRASIYSRNEHQCRLPCQTSAKNLIWIPLPYAQSWSKHCAKMMLPCVNLFSAKRINISRFFFAKYKCTPWILVSAVAWQMARSASIRLRFAALSFGQHILTESPPTSCAFLFCDLPWFLLRVLPISLLPPHLPPKPVHFPSAQLVSASGATCAPTS